MPPGCWRDILSALRQFPKWKLSFEGKNLTDARYFTAANGAGGFVGAGRNYFGKLQYQFGANR